MTCKNYLIAMKSGAGCNMKAIFSPDSEPASGGAGRFYALTGISGD